MPKDSAKVRLPELPVFKKYSLALRQEFASAEEMLSVLERTATKIRDGIERADEERRRQDQLAMPDEVEPQDEGFEEIAPASESQQEAESDETERPFWEEPSEEGDYVPAASGSSLSTARSRPPSKAKSKPKTRRPKPSVVRVGHHGKPLTSKKAAPKRAAPKRAAPKRAAPKRAAPKRAAPKRAAPKRAAPKRAAPKKAAPKRVAPKKKAATRKSVSSRSKPKARAGSRRR